MIDPQKRVGSRGDWVVSACWLGRDEHDGCGDNADRVPVTKTRLKRCEEAQASKVSAAAEGVAALTLDINPSAGLGGDVHDNTTAIQLARVQSSFRRDVEHAWHRQLQRRSQRARWNVEKVKRFEARLTSKKRRVRAWPKAIAVGLAADSSVTLAPSWSSSRG